MAAPAAPQGTRARMVGFDNFKRHNPFSDKFASKKFHHIEFWTGDALNVAKRFAYALGMTFTVQSNMSTGNHTYASYAVQTGELVFVFTAPYGRRNPEYAVGSSMPHPGFTTEFAQEFFNKHGFAARAIGVEVEDAEAAHTAATANGGKSVLAPVTLPSRKGGYVKLAEIHVYGDAVMRFVSYHDGCPDKLLPGYEEVTGDLATRRFYGIQRLDHVVGNLPEIGPVFDYIMAFTGFHQFSEFTTEDVGTLDSGLNSMVLANNNEMVIMPLNEPTFGTPRKSQIQTYLEQNEGPGVQHLALKTPDIFDTLRKMRSVDPVGFDFMPKPVPTYYKNMRARIGDILTEQNYLDCEELGILVDKDDQGVLLQIFTKPVSDRSTVFLEIIQRICFTEEEAKKKAEAEAAAAKKVEEVGGCGGFGKGNFGELFRSIEEYEKTLDVKPTQAAEPQIRM